MPLVKVTVFRRVSAQEKRELADRIHEALVQCFKIPDDDYNHHFVELEGDNALFIKNRTENYTQIEMTIFPGRSREAKTSLYAKITSSLGELGIAARDVMIVLNEPPLENWGLAGKSGIDSDIGFDLNV